MIAVILAAYDEAAVIGAVLAGVSPSIAGHSTAVVVVDDGSGDGTAEVASRHGAHVVRLPSNGGKAAALAVARREAAKLGAAFLVELDADGQHDPAYLPALVEPVVHGTADVVVGSRYLMSRARGATPLNRYLVRCIVSRMLRGLLAQPASDPFSGYRCYRRELLENLRLEARRYDGELELRFEVARTGARLMEVAVPRIYGPQTSKMHRRGGALVGRLRVLGQYGAVMVTGTARMWTQPLVGDG